jgi:hypothetical protein
MLHRIAESAQHAAAQIAFALAVALVVALVPLLEGVRFALERLFASER